MLKINLKKMASHWAPEDFDTRQVDEPGFEKFGDGKKRRFLFDNKARNWYNLSSLSDLILSKPNSDHLNTFASR